MQRKSVTIHTLFLKYSLITSIQQVATRFKFEQILKRNGGVEMLATDVANDLSRLLQALCTSYTKSIIGKGVVWYVSLRMAFSCYGWKMF